MANSQNSTVLVLSTFPDRETALHLARQLQERKYVACASVGPAITSVYEWQGQICEDTEFTLTLKTLQARAESVSAFIKQHHPYDLPEILFVPVDGDAEYLEWIEQCVSTV